MCHFNFRVNLVNQCHNVSCTTIMPKHIARKAPKKNACIKVREKLEILDKLNNNVAVKDNINQYNTGRLKAYDIQVAKEIIRAFSLTVEPSLAHLMKMIIKNIKFEANFKVVYEWYVQQRANGVPVRCMELISATNSLAEMLKIGCCSTQETNRIHWPGIQVKKCGDVMCSSEWDECKAVRE